MRSAVAPFLLFVALAGLARAAPPSTSWQEIVPDDEPTRFAEYLTDIRRMQDRNAAAGDGTVRRGFHAKSHAAVRAVFRVPESTPAHLRHGIFATPGDYHALVRLSNGLGTLQSDRLPDVRGFAVKVLGVEGPSLLEDPDEGIVQDFVTINHPYLPIRDIEQLMALIRALESPGSLVFKLPRILGAQGAGRALEFASTRLTRRTRSLITEDFWSTLPMKLGPYAAKVKFRHANVAEGRTRTSPDYLRADLQRRLARKDLRFDVMVQLFVDETRTPIEDGSVEWSEEDSPFLKVAELVIPRQDLTSSESEATATRVEALRFNPWHAHPDLRPLGSLMRARKAVYEASADYRQGTPGS